MPIYRDARLKVKRANEHIANVNAAIHALKNSCIATVEQRPDGGQSLKHELPNFRNALDDLSLIVGDALHNLHTALDFAWYSAMQRCLPDKVSASTKFPVRETQQGLEAALHGIEVDARCKALFDCVVSKIQPYKGGDNGVIWALHDLDISDKHILLLELGPRGHITGMAVRDESGELHTGSTYPADGVEGRYIVDFQSGLKIEDKGKLSFTVTLQEAGMFKHLSVSDLLSSFGNFTIQTVNLLENLTC